MSALVHHARRRAAPMPFRPDLRATIEGLIALLDALDGDIDLEDGHDAEFVNEDGDVLDAGELDEAEMAQRWHERHARHVA